MEEKEIVRLKKAEVMEFLFSCIQQRGVTPKSIKIKNSFVQNDGTKIFAVSSEIVDDLKTIVPNVNDMMNHFKNFGIAIIEKNASSDPFDGLRKIGVDDKLILQLKSAMDLIRPKVESQDMVLNVVVRRKRGKGDEKEKE